MRGTDRIRRSGAPKRVTFGQAHLGATGVAASFALFFASIFQPGVSLGAGQHAKPKKKPVSSAPSFERDVLPVVNKFCVDCHTGKDAPAGIVLDKTLTGAQAMANRALWDKVALNIGSGHMPPPNNPRPTALQRQALASWIQASEAASCAVADPGRVTIRRLNREEYDHTIRDLIGVDFHPAADFPSDDVGYGFDNIGDVLSVSPLLLEKYLAAAETIATKAIYAPDEKVRTVLGSEMRDDKGAQGDENPRTVSSNFAIRFKTKLPRYGFYRFKVLAAGEQAGPEPVKMALEVDRKEVARFDVTNRKANIAEFETRTKSDAEEHEYSIRFLNDFYDPNLPADRRDRNLIVQGAQLIGPLGGEGSMSEAQKALWVADPKVEGEPTAARKIITNFASRAFRRPSTLDEQDRLMKIYELSRKAGETFEQGVRAAIEATLVSPSFLYRVEKDSSAGKSGKQAVGDYELASRLSYFLWSSMPDARLMTLAGQGKLHDPTVLRAEASRLLTDPRAESLADDFAQQWLQLRLLSTFNPSPAMFPTWSEDLRQSMFTETRMFINGVVKNDRSVIDFLDGRYSYLNETLAKHYGVPGVYGNDFRKVDFPTDVRAGLLTQGAVLAVTSNPTRTSPTKRGRWVLEELLGTPPPPPPPGVGNLKDEAVQLKASTLRGLMEQHRKNPICASCHSSMDPIGFGLDNFDATGRWRTLENGFPIDSSGILPDGRKFVGPAQLRAILLTNKDGFVHCLAEKLMTYALGRGLTYNDKCALDGIVAETKRGNYKFSALVRAIVSSQPFRFRGSDTKGIQVATR